MKIKLADGSGTINLKYLLRDVDRHGKERIYFRRKGQPKVHLRSAIGTPAFLEEYQQAFTGDSDEPAKPIRPANDRETLRWLVEAYCRSGDFRRLSPRTQKVRRRILERICATRDEKGRPNGTKRYAMMQARHVVKIRDENVDLPEAANAKVKALRQLFAWASSPEVGHVDPERNPARAVQYIRTDTEGFYTWTVDDVLQYYERHPLGTPARLAIDILLYTGARRSDAVTFGRQMVRDGLLRWTEFKGRKRKRKERLIPILPPLQASLDACPSGHLTWLVTSFGKPFTSNGFGNWFRKRCDEAGLPQCSAHGLRKAGATLAANNGAPSHALMAIFGWETLKQAEVYTRKADRARLAAEYMHLIDLGVDSEQSAQPMSSRLGNRRKSEA